ncbi:MAG: hypothetical protein KDG52_20290 [Rhodocyclaceae bacterium]|nr:hypothetical protein [Rhodocyclaceae bacterium]
MTIRAPFRHTPRHRHRIAFALLALVTGSCLPAAASDSLAHSRWVRSGTTACPDAIYFGVRRYLFLNTCHAPKPDGVVERGRYAFDGGRIELLERTAVGETGIDGVGPSLRTLVVDDLSEDRLLLRAGRRRLEFLRSRPIRLMPAAFGRPATSSH